MKNGQSKEYGQCPVCGHALVVSDTGMFTDAPFTTKNDIDYLSLFCAHCGASVIVNSCKRKNRAKYDYYKHEISQN